MGLKSTCFLLVLCCIFQTGFGQSAGDKAFVSSDLIFSARMGGLGTNGHAIKDGDLNLGVYNPALLDSNNHNQFSFSYINYIHDLNYGQVAYSQHFQKLGTFAASVNYLSYGKITETDIYGEELGNVSAGEYIFSISGARQIDSLFSVGANLKMFYGQMAEYSSTALAVDLAGVYHNPKINTTMSLMLLNIGAPLSYYTETDRPDMPFEIQFGISHRLGKAPFRFTLVAENLQRWKLVNEHESVEERDPITGEITTKSKDTFGENLMRHFVVGVEVLIGKNMFLRGGFNYRRRQELKAPDRTGLSGISFGAGLKIYKFHLSYSRATYNLAGASNHITITTRFSDFAAKR